MTVPRAIAPLYASQTLRRARAAVRPAPIRRPRLYAEAPFDLALRARRQPLRVARGGDARALDRRVRRRPAGDQELAGRPARRRTRAATGRVGRPRRATGRRRRPRAVSRRANGPRRRAAPSRRRARPTRCCTSARARRSSNGRRRAGSSSPSGSHARGIAPVWSAGRGEDALVDGMRPAAALSRRSPAASISRNCGTCSRGAQLLVAPDTGVAHLGRIVGVPTVALFGPGSAVLCGAGDFWRDAPYRAVTVEPFPCRDQRVLFKREIAWVRRCGRSVARVPGASLHAGDRRRRRRSMRSDDARSGATRMNASVRRSTRRATAARSTMTAIAGRRPARGERGADERVARRSRRTTGSTDLLWDEEDQARRTDVARRGDRRQQARDRRLQPAAQRRDRADRRGAARAARRRRAARRTRGTTRRRRAR